MHGEMRVEDRGIGFIRRVVQKNRCIIDNDADRSQRRRSLFDEPRSGPGLCQIRLDGNGFAAFCLISLANSSACAIDSLAWTAIAKPWAARSVAIARPSRRAAPVIKTVFGIFSFTADLHLLISALFAGYKCKSQAVRQPQKNWAIFYSKCNFGLI